MKSVLVILIFSIGTSAAKVLLSDFIPICNAKDPNLNACVVKSANLLVPVLAKGIRSYGFPPLDPLRVSVMDVGQSHGAVNLKLKLIDTVHTGLSTLYFRSAEIDTKSNRWILNGTLPFYSLEGKYTGKGRILLVPINGNGDANFTFHNTGVNFDIRGTPKKMKGDIYFSLTKLRVYFTFDKTKVSVTNLFGGNKQLGETTSTFLRENSNEVVNGLKDTLEDVYSSLYGSLLNKIFSNVPYNEILRQN